MNQKCRTWLLILTKKNGNFQKDRDPGLKPCVISILDFNQHHMRWVLEVWMRVTCALSCLVSLCLWCSLRLNFTLRHMDVSCEAYDHFRSCLDQITVLREKHTKFTVTPVSCSFPQFFQYERVNQLVRRVPFPVLNYKPLEKWVCSYTQKININLTLEDCCVTFRGANKFEGSWMIIVIWYECSFKFLPTNGKKKISWESFEHFQNYWHP